MKLNTTTDGWSSAHWKTSMPINGWCRSGFVALLPSSGPKPSSPKTVMSVERREHIAQRTIGSSLAERNRHDTVILVGSQCPMCHTSTRNVRDFAAPSAKLRLNIHPTGLVHETPRTGYPACTGRWNKADQKSLMDMVRRCTQGECRGAHHLQSSSTKQ